MRRRDLSEKFHLKDTLVNARLIIEAILNLIAKKNETDSHSLHYYPM